MTPMSDLFAESGFSYAEIDRHRSELSAELTKMLKKEFEPLGFEMTDFRIENTDFDEDTKRRINKIADQMAEAQAMNALGEIQGQSMNNFAQIEKLKAMNTAAANEGMAGTGLGAGMGMGMGMGMGNMFNQQMMQPQAFQQPPQPPAAPMVACAGCNAQMPQTAKFCPSCGQPNMAGKAACVSCKAPIAQGAKFCPECGSPQQASCPSCKAQLAPGAKFCPECGTKTA